MRKQAEGRSEDRPSFPRERTNLTAQADSVCERCRGQDLLPGGSPVSTGGSDGIIPVRRGRVLRSGCRLEQLYAAKSTIRVVAISLLIALNSPRELGCNIPEFQCECTVP